MSQLPRPDDPEVGTSRGDEQGMEITEASRRSSPEHGINNGQMELPSSPYASPPSQLEYHSSPLALRSSPHHSAAGSSPHGSSLHDSPPMELESTGPTLAIHSSPYRSPSTPQHSYSTSGSAHQYSPTLHRSLSSSPTESPSGLNDEDSPIPYGIAAMEGAGLGPEPKSLESPSGPLPTKVDAYKPRGLRSRRLNKLNVANVALRAFAAVFTLISFSVIASNKDNYGLVVEDSRFDGSNFGRLTVNFDDFFYLSYLLTANVLVFVYTLVTMGLFMYYMNMKRPVENFWLIASVFSLDQIFSYLLMSASSSAASAIRAQRSLIDDKLQIDLTELESFESQAYAGVAMSFIAFFLLALLALISGYHVVNRKRL